jgi:hypothetical protein
VKACDACGWESDFARKRCAICRRHHATVEHDGTPVLVYLETERQGPQWQRRAFTIASGWDLERSEFWAYGSRGPGTEADLLAAIEQEMAKTWTAANVAEIMERNRIVPRVIPPKPWLPEEDGPFPPCCVLGMVEDGWTCQVVEPEPDDESVPDFHLAFEARLRGRPENRYQRSRQTQIERAYLAVANQKPPSARRIAWMRRLREIRQAKLQPADLDPRLLP